MSKTSWPTLTGAARIAAKVAAVDCPRRRVKLVGRYARDVGTLTPPLAALRVRDMTSLRLSGLSADDIAADAQITPRRVRALTQAALAAVRAAATAPRETEIPS